MNHFAASLCVVMCLLLTRALYEAIGSRQAGWIIVFSALSVAQAYAAIGNILQIIK